MQKLIKELLKFRSDRQWKKYHTPKELARAISVEVGELNREFLWNDEFDKAAVVDEIADIFIFLIYLANEIQCCLLCEAWKKMRKNADKYPVESSKNLW